MISIGLIHLGILPLLLEAMTPVYAQHDQREQDARRQQQEPEAKGKRPQPARPERPEKPQPPHEAKPQGQPRPERPDRQEKLQPRPVVKPERPSQPERPTRREPPQQRPEAKPERPPAPARRVGPVQAPRPTPHAQPPHERQHQSAWPARRAQNWQTEHRTWQDRGGYRGYRIPDARYHGFFGPSHGFRLFHFPLIVIGGFPRFQFNGLWFSVMDPWPEYWAETWYGDDDLYIEFWAGGYYLFNRRHPMDRIAITVYLD